MTAILLLSVALAGQQCGPRGCPAPSFAPVLAAPTFAQAVRYAEPAAAPKYYVVKRHRVVHEGLHFEVEGYQEDSGKIRWEMDRDFNRQSYLAAKQSAATHAPAVRPSPSGDDRPVGQVTGQALNFGMEPGRMGDKSRYTAPSEKARQFIQESAGPDVKLHVTVIGSDDNRAPVVNDLMTNPAFASVRGSMLVQDYAPGEWEVDPSLGFKTDGQPTILVQTGKSAADPKGGRVVYRASDYSMGAEALAEEIRKINPNYKPAVDPGPATGKKSTGVCPLGFTDAHWPYILIVGIGVFFVYRLPRKGG